MIEIDTEKKTNSRADFKNSKRILLKSTRSTHVQTQAEYGLFSSKRSQHETMGFIVIVSLVIIVGVIFLGIKMNQPNKANTYQDSQIINFLSASSKYTSDCFENHEPLTLNDLKEKCYRNGDERCTSNDVMTLCELLNDTYSKMLATSWLIDDGSPTRYYELKVYSKRCDDNSTTPLIIQLPLTPEGFKIEAGNLSQCSSSSIRTGQESYPIRGSGEECIVSDLKICQKEIK